MDGVRPMSATARLLLRGTAEVAEEMRGKTSVGAGGPAQQILTVHDPGVLAGMYGQIRATINHPSIANGGALDGPLLTRMNRVLTDAESAASALRDRHPGSRRLTLYTFKERAPLLETAGSDINPGDSKRLIEQVLYASPQRIARDLREILDRSS